MGLFSIASNSPYTPTGYGVQAGHLVEGLLSDGHEVAALSNYGLEGSLTTLQTPAGTIPHYPRGLTLYSGDVLKMHHDHFVAGRKQPNKIITLYDAWVYLEQPGLEDAEFWSWTPVDHITIPPKVLAWAMKPNVKTIAMSPFGQQQFKQHGIEATYIPHSVDTKVYKPAKENERLTLRRLLGLDDEAFLVGMVAANKANGSIHRKAFAENLLAFALFRKENPNSYLYIHTQPGRQYGGFDLTNLMRAVGLPTDSVIFPDSQKLIYGYSAKEMATLYSAFDVLLHASYGEGFGVPAIEAQACGTRVIGAGWSATPDILSEESWTVDGQPFWDEAQLSFYRIPLIPSLIVALQKAHEAHRRVCKTSVNFAKGFDTQAVWERYWRPFIESSL
jgi:glycosyltransferase involved in cell wall biosynthesis